MGHLRTLPSGTILGYWQRKDKGYVSGPIAYQMVGIWWLVLKTDQTLALETGFGSIECHFAGKATAKNFSVMEMYELDIIYVHS